MTSRMSAPTKLKVTVPSLAGCTDAVDAGGGLTNCPVPGTVCGLVLGDRAGCAVAGGVTAIGAGACDGGSTAEFTSPS